MNILKAFLSAWIICFSFCEEAEAQYEINLTQYMNNELIINPGYAGSRDHISVVFAYRDQWSGIEGAPNTQTFSVHAPLKNRRLALGLSLVKDQIGVTNLFSVLGTFAYRMPVTEEGILSLGLQGGFFTIQEDYSELQTECCNNFSDPLFMEDSPTRLAPRIGFGAYYYDKNFYAGWSIPRLTASYMDPLNDFKVNNNFEPKGWHHYLITGYLVETSENVTLKPSMMTKIVHGAPVEVDLSLSALLDDRIWVGASYRTGDSFSFLTSLLISEQLRVGYSYDLSINELSDFNDGSHEVMIGYDFNFRKLNITSIRYF